MKAVLTVNGGSSSLKCALYRLDQSHQLNCHYSFKLTNILRSATFTVKNYRGEVIDTHHIALEHIDRELRHQTCLQAVIDWLESADDDIKLYAIGHRIVHGGTKYEEPMLIDETSIDELSEFIPLAPLHQPYNLQLINACHALLPHLPQVACFDTMFHRNQPRIEQNYALPKEITDEGIHRYGFHGLSYEYICRQLQQQNTLAEKTIVCHLGAGASMCALDNGISKASSMGFSAVDGLPMSSRCGSLDPGVVLYLLRHNNMNCDELEQLLYKQSGWLGVSGISSDMLELHQADQEHAEEAIDMFCYRAALEIGRLTAALQGLDQIVFTGGVGENDSDVRARILERCRWLGITVDHQANRKNQQVISCKDSKVTVNVIATDEEAMISLHTLEVLDNI